MENLSSAQRPIHLMQIIGGAIVGGMETYVLRLIQKLPKDQFKVFCICPFESQMTAQLREAGCTVHTMPIPDEPDWSSIQFGLAVIRSSRIDVIHAHLPNAHILAGIIGKLTDTPTVATLHSRNISMRDFEIHKLMATHLSVVSKSAYFHALSLGVRETQVQFIPNGVDTAVFRPDANGRYLHSLLNLPPLTPMIGFVGRLSHEKGPDIFVRAAIAAHERLPDCHFVLIGEGPMHERLLKDIKDAGLTKFIHLIGLHKDMPRIYRSLDMMMLTSFSEGMPLALLEAMASGLPVIATQVGGVMDIVEVGTTGLLSRPGDFEDMAHNVVALMASPLLRDRMGKAARLRIEQNFKLAQSIDQMCKLLGSMVPNGHRSEAKISALTPPGEMIKSA
jgi:glycosyltransferase involved in cell wall biosynthesis